MVEKIKYTDTLRQGTDKLNVAIEQANVAEVESKDAKVKSETALSTANEAFVMVDDIVSGAVSTEELNTNIAEKLLKIEQDYAPELTQVKSQLAEKVNQEDLDEVDFKLKQINGLSTELKNIYVDVNTGDDEQGDGSESNPFKTIQKAVDTIPKIINKDHHIICKPGTYDEEVVVQSIFGAGVFITCPEANQDPSQPTGFSVVSISFFDCHGYCIVQNFDAFKGDTFKARAHIVFSRCAYGSVGKCRFDSWTKNNENGKASVLFDGSVGSLQSNFWTNQHRCLHAMNGAQVRVDESNATGTESIYGITAQAATVYKNGNVVLSAQIPEQKLQGGQIW